MKLHHCSPRNSPVAEESPPFTSLTRLPFWNCAGTRSCRNQHHNTASQVRVPPSGTASRPPRSCAPPLPCGKSNTVSVWEGNRTRVLWLEGRGGEQSFQDSLQSRSESLNWGNENTGENEYIMWGIKVFGKLKLPSFLGRTLSVGTCKSPRRADGLSEKRQTAYVQRRQSKV